MANPLTLRLMAFQKRRRNRRKKAKIDRRKAEKKYLRSLFAQKIRPFFLSSFGDLGSVKDDNFNEYKDKQIDDVINLILAYKHKKRLKR